MPAALYDSVMTVPVRFHVLIIPTVSWPELLRRARQVEQLGFDALALPDHLVDWTNPPAPWYDAWTALAAIAQATETVRLTTAVTQIPLRNPAMLARQVLTLDQISNGRVELGLGTGLTIDPSYRMAGLPNWSPAERPERFGEYLELVCQLLAQETDHLRGPLLPGRRRRHEPTPDPAASPAGHGRRPGTEDDAPRRPPRRHLE